MLTNDGLATAFGEPRRGKLAKGPRGLRGRERRKRGRHGHWAKEFEHVPGIVGIARAQLGERLERFLRALESAGTDPQGGMFVNPLIDRLVLAGRPARRDSGATPEAAQVAA